MKKVLLLTENFPPIEGGSGRWFWELYSRIPRDKVVVLTHNVEGGSEFDKRHSLCVIRTPMSSAEWGFKSVTGIKFYWRLVKQVRKIVKQHNIEEIHCGRVIHEGVIAWLIKMLTGIPYLCFVHGEDVETAATSREQSLMVRKVCGASKMLICNSYNSKKLVVNLGFESEEKCEVLHPGVDTTKFVPADPDSVFRDEMEWTNKQVLLTVGRLQQRKGQDYLIQAMPDLLKVYPNLFYAVVGRGECEEALRELIQKLKLENHVKIYIDLNDEDLIRCYQQCDCFILPNRTIGNDIEGFGMVLVEAQACGKPVIAGDSGGTAETMIIGKTGQIIDCSTPSQLVEGLEHVLAEPKFMSSGKQGLKHVKSNLDWQAHVLKALELFKR
ncbi:glycosyltransferase family 4 protein [Alteromonas sp. 1_MG-2023]|uniref:glycosyltransferase family 4 protein n=1 Tax=Alteromonas sp. 1_MG-2023 TaxID=3062669 RepID=UPI0026E19DE5|nr:glycosyltransferase family 4 protein [Alteromonas sp. 1_MG-2023]MDO6566336.1 glycosyltransferase family 4 protein [Alteromonas sp. 1_MG-2023]